MWFIFDSIELKHDLVSRAGRTFTGYVLKGERKGYDKDPNTPYEKILFENTATTVIEKGIERPNCSIVQFFQKACSPGDIVIMKFVRRGGNMWDIASVEKLGESRDLPTYEPLTEEQEKALKSQGVEGSEATLAATGGTPAWVR